MRRPDRSPVALSLAAALTLVGCGGEPFYHERTVPPRSPAHPVQPGPAQPATTAPPPPTSATRPAPSAAAPSAPASTPAPQPSTPAAQSNSSQLPGGVDAEDVRRSATGPRTPAQTRTSAPERSGTGTPTRTRERPGASPTRTPATSSNRPPRAEPAYLDELGGPGSGPAPIGGSSYPHSFSASACTVFSQQPTYTWNLGGRYGTLRGVAGQDDGSESREAVLRLTVRGDGRTLASRTVRYGQTAGLRVSVAGVQRLSVSFTEVSCAAGQGAALVFGSPRLS